MVKAAHNYIIFVNTLCDYDVKVAVTSISLSSVSVLRQGHSLAA